MGRKKHNRLVPIGECSETSVIAYPEKKIHTIIHKGVFCVDKSGFLILGHIYYSYIYIYNF